MHDAHLRLLKSPRCFGSHACGPGESGVAESQDTSTETGLLMRMWSHESPAAAAVEPTDAAKIISWPTAQPLRLPVPAAAWL